MSIYKNNKETEAINHSGTKFEAVYHMGKLVWEAIRSCFGSGYWKNDAPWLNNDGWKN